MLKYRDNSKLLQAFGMFFFKGRLLPEVLSKFDQIDQKKLVARASR